MSVTTDYIEEMRRYGADQALCELALDGLRFRAWCEGASTFSNPGVSALAKLLANCTKPQDYREAIDRFLVMKTKRAA